MPIVRAISLAGCLAFGAALFAVAQPAADPSAPPNQVIKSPGDTSSAPLAKGRNSFTSNQAKSRIEHAGYTDVSMLAVDGDGLWQATAMRDGQSVHVALDYKGDIAAQ
jgi:hypothetical protein